MKDTDEVINIIKSTGAKMHSRRYFVAKTILAIVGAICLFFILLFVVSFIIFILQENGGLFATTFGPGGWLTFFYALPWSFLLLSIALILVLWLLLRRYAIIYHQPFIYILLFLIVIVSLTLFFLSASAIHGGIMRYTSRNQIPLVSGVYEFETTPMNGMYRGQVMFLATSSFVIENVFGHDVATATINAAGVETIVDYQ